MNPGEGDRSADISQDELRKLHEKRLRRVADIAVENGEDVLILGAFGCGAFRNPPEVVARAMKPVVEEYRYCFKTIEITKDERVLRILSHSSGEYLSAVLQRCPPHPGGPTLYPRLFPVRRVQSGAYLSDHSDRGVLHGPRGQTVPG